MSEWFQAFLQVVGGFANVVGRMHPLWFLSQWDEKAGEKIPDGVKLLNLFLLLGLVIAMVLVGGLFLLYKFAVKP